MQRVRLHKRSLKLHPIEELAQGSDRPPQGLAIANQGVDRVCDARLSCDPLLQQGLKTLHIQLSEQKAAIWPKASVAEPLGGMVESDGGLATSVPRSSFSVVRCRLAKRSMPMSESWLL
jgi:hypothetical protein